MTTKHTPGPWHRNVAPATKYTVIFAGRNEHIAAIRHAKIGDEAEANHDLIAAAPDLLAALENAANVLAALATGQLEKIERDSPALMKCRAAIAKAKGQS